MKTKGVFISLVLIVLIFNLIFGNKTVTFYIKDTIYATTYFGLTLVLIGLSLLVFLFYAVINSFFKYPPKS